MVSYLGSLVQLCCGEGGKMQTNIAGVCGECSQCMDHTGFAPAHSGLCFLGLHCSGCRVPCRALSKAGPGFCALSSSKTLRFRFSGTPQGHRLGWACSFVPFPGPSSSEDQVLGECTVQGGPCFLITSLVLGARLPRCAARALSQVCCVSPLGSCPQAVTILADVNCPGRHG